MWWHDVVYYILVFKKLIILLLSNILGFGLIIGLGAFIARFL